MIDWQEMLSADVLTLGMAADDVRREVSGANVVTYLRVHEFNDNADVPLAASELRRYALPPSFDEAVAYVRAMRAAAGHRRVVAYSFADLAQREWADAAHLQALVDAGLSDVAELPVDRIGDVSAALDMLTAAGLHPARLTVSHPIGDNRVELIRKVQQAFDRHPSLRRFAPLPRVAPVDKPTTGYDDVRMVAIARLALRHRSIEVDWTLYGPKLAQVALMFGADHLDAVSALEDTSLGPRRGTVEDVQRNIRAAGFEPQEQR